MKDQKTLCAFAPSDPFVKAALAEKAVLQLVANLGVVCLNEVIRVFQPMNLDWNEKVNQLTKACLAWAYKNDPKSINHFKPTEKTMQLLGEPPRWTKSWLNKLRYQASPKKLCGQEVSSLIHISGAQRLVKKVKVAPPDEYVLELHWMRCRAIAAEYVDNSASVRGKRVISRLLEKRLIVARSRQGRGFQYALTSRGAQYLGEGYRPTTDRTSMRSIHRTLANGYLLSSLERAYDGWSEASLFADNGTPGLRGTPPMFTHRRLHASLGWSKDKSIHPSDGVILYVRERSAKDVSWGIELVESEHGNKVADEFARSLYPITSGKNPDVHHMKITKDAAGNTTKHVSRVEKITFVLANEEFLTPLLTGCLQFVTGYKKDVHGHFSKSEKNIFIGSQATHLNSENARLEAKWEELLSMVDVAFCAINPINETFLGVIKKESLSVIARNRGLSPMHYLKNEIGHQLKQKNYSA